MRELRRGGSRPGSRGCRTCCAVRGRGLMLACELDVAAPEVVRRALLEQRLVVNATGPTTRAPAAAARSIGAAEIDEALARLAARARRAEPCSARSATASSSTTIPGGSTSTPSTPTSAASPTGAAGARARSCERAICAARARVVGLYHDGAQVGFARAVSDGATVAYLADVYVLARLPRSRARPGARARDRSTGESLPGRALAAAHGRRPAAVREARLRDRAADLPIDGSAAGRRPPPRQAGREVGRQAPRLRARLGTGRARLATRQPRLRPGRLA